MLQEKYLPQYHFNEKHSIIIDRSAEHTFSLIDKFDFSDSNIVRILLFLRGMRWKTVKKEDLHASRFIELEQIPNKEIIIGLIGQFWRPAGNLQKFAPDEFIPFERNGFAKASWNFQIIPKDNNSCELQTETRILCIGEKTKQNFSRYWFFVHPFSALIRKQMLKSIKRKAERVSRDL